MSLRLVFRRAAQRELDQAARWYEFQRPRLGVEFVAEIQQVLESLSAHPQQFPIADGDVRGVGASLSILHRLPRETPRGGHHRRVPFVPRTHDLAKPNLTESMEIAMSDITPRVSLKEFRPSLWWFGAVFLCERFVRFSIFMGVLWFDLPAILCMICGTDSRPESRRWMLWMRALMVWCVLITFWDIYSFAYFPGWEFFQRDQQVQGSIYLMTVLSVKLVWSTINLFLLLRDKRASQQTT